jgi:hypothetical protein
MGWIGALVTGQRFDAFHPCREIRESIGQRQKFQLQRFCRVFARRSQDSLNQRKQAYISGRELFANESPRMGELSVNPLKFLAHSLRSFLNFC